MVTGDQNTDHLEEMDHHAVSVQANWRRCLAQMSYQFDIIDIVILQSVARRWKTCRVLALVCLQCFARVCIANARFDKKMAMHSLVMRHTSATKIQARRRGHMAQMTLLQYIKSVKIEAR